MSEQIDRSCRRRGIVLVVIVVVMAVLSLVVAGSIRPVRDESEIAMLRVETTRAFYAAESGAFIIMNAVMGNTEMPDEGSVISMSGQTIQFVQLPDENSDAIVEGASGDAVRRIQLQTE